MGNRIIKFRGWNGEKMFLYNYWFTLEHQSTLCFDMYKEHSYVDASDVDYPKRIELMQFTGLHDKNGKEVWEGDIVRDCSQHWDDYNTKLHDKTGFVKYLGDGIGMAEFEVVNNTDSIIVKSDCNNNWFSLSNSVEVIGNVWENPELLE